MKNWIKSHHRVIISILLFVVIYVLLFGKCIDYVNFEGGNRNLYPAIEEYNMKVARFYFLQLPFAASIPSLFYMIISFLNSKI